MAALPGRGRRREAAAARRRLARTAGGRRGGRLDDDPDPRLLERKGEARARLAAEVAKLARRLSERPHRSRRSEISILGSPSRLADQPRDASGRKGGSEPSLALRPVLPLTRL